MEAYYAITKRGVRRCGRDRYGQLLCILDSTPLSEKEIRQILEDSLEEIKREMPEETFTINQQASMIKDLNRLLFDLLDNKTIRYSYN